MTRQIGKMKTGERHQIKRNRFNKCESAGAKMKELETRKPLYYFKRGNDGKIGRENREEDKRP